MEELAEAKTVVLVGMHQLHNTKNQPWFHEQSLEDQCNSNFQLSSDRTLLHPRQTAYHRDLLRSSLELPEKQTSQMTLPNTAIISNLTHWKTLDYYKLTFC